MIWVDWIVSSSSLTLAGTFDSVGSSRNPHGLRVVEVFLLFGAEAVVGVVLKVGHVVACLFSEISGLRVQLVIYYEA